MKSWWKGLKELKDDNWIGKNYVKVVVMIKEVLKEGEWY